MALIPSFRRIGGACTLLVLSVLAAAGPAWATRPDRPADPGAEALRPFKNWFVTGDYAAAGVTLAGRGDRSGFATASIDLRNRIPDDAEIVAAYLYWTAVARTGTRAADIVAGARFKKNPIDGAAVVVGREDNVPKQCGGDWRYSASTSTYTFRADVLRFLPRRRPADRSEPVRIPAAALHEVSLPERGNASGPSTLGAGLVVVWRRAGYAAPDFSAPLEPLRAIVLYEGAANLNAERRRLETTMRGFYEAARAWPAARLSTFVAHGRADAPESLWVNGTTMPSWGLPFAFDPFPSSRRDPGYAVPTFRHVPLVPGAMQARVAIEAGRDKGQLQCLTWSAAVLSTEVQDTDLDGLLDVWESREQWDRKPPLLRDAYDSWPLAAFDPLREGRTDFPPARLPDLQAMGADPLVQDLFVQIDYMKDEATGRSHAPSLSALRWVATAFRDAAPRPSLANRLVCPPDRLHCERRDLCAGNCPINVRFDVARLYGPERCTDGTYCPFIAPEDGGIGGRGIQEEPCSPSNAQFCAFPAVQGAIPWKNGFRAIRDARIDSSGEVCEGGERGCERRFPSTRKDIFRYALFARALALPSPSDPSQPRRSSGVADTNGGDLMVTLGLWDGLGSEFVQASTLKHEIGHTLGLRHGGLVVPPPSTASHGTARTGPVLGTNCRPNYQSVMNYLFQIGGVRDSAGTPQLSFSAQTLDPIRESALDEVAGLRSSLGDAQAPSEFLPRWYAPRIPPGGIDARVGATPAQRRCDGTPLAADDMPLFRLDGAPRTGSGDTGLRGLDWNGDGIIAGFPAVDADFDGVIGNAAVAGANDYATLDLRQVGGRRGIGSEALSRSVLDPDRPRRDDPRTGSLVPLDQAPIGGGLSLNSQPADYLGYADLGYADLGAGELGYADLGYDLGYADLGYADLGYADLGYADLGYADLGYADLGAGELGYADLGYGDLGYADLGYGDLGYGDLGIPPEDAPTTVASARSLFRSASTAPRGWRPPLGEGAITFETAVATAVTPPVLAAAREERRVLLSWQAPVVGRVLEYRVFRVAGNGAGDAAALEPYLTLAGTLTNLVDEPGTGPWTYFVVAAVENPDAPKGVPVVTGASNLATVVVPPPPSCRLVEVLASDTRPLYQRVVTVPFATTDPRRDSALQTNGLRLTSMGNLFSASGALLGHVWRIENSGAARNVTLRLAGGPSYPVALSEDAETFVVGKPGTHVLQSGHVQITKASGPQAFTDSREIACPAP